LVSAVSFIALFAETASLPRVANFRRAVQRGDPKSADDCEPTSDFEEPGGFWNLKESPASLRAPAESQMLPTADQRRNKRVKVAVWPLIAADPPHSLAATNQVVAVVQRAGMFFWSWATAGLGLLALAALLTSFGAPRPHVTWRIASTVLMLIVVATTLLYFRPTIIGLVVHHGGGQQDVEIAAEMRRWVMLNWVRNLAVSGSVGMAVRALLRLGS
jgi:hypothetical protein